MGSCPDPAATCVGGATCCKANAATTLAPAATTKGGTCVDTSTRYCLLKHICDNSILVVHLGYKTVFVLVLFTQVHRSSNIVLKVVIFVVEVVSHVLMPILGKYPTFIKFNVTVFARSQKLMT